MKLYASKIPVVISVLMICSSGSAYAQSSSDGFFDKGFVTKGFGNSSSNAADQKIKSPSTSDSWSLTPKSDTNSIDTKAKYDSPPSDSWSVNNDTGKVPGPPDPNAAINQLKETQSAQGKGGWSAQKKVESGRFGFKEDSHSTTSTPTVTKSEGPKTAPDIQKHITGIMEQLRGTESREDLRTKVNSISSYVAERVKQSDTSPQAGSTSAPSPLFNATKPPSNPAPVPLEPVSGSENVLRTPPLDTSRSAPVGRSAFEMKAPKEPIVQNPDDASPSAVSPAILSLIVSNSSQAHVLKNIEELLKVHKKQGVPVGEVLIVGTPSLQSFFDPEIWKLFDDIEQAGIIVRPVLSAPSRLGISRSPAWVVRQNGQDYVFEAEQSPGRLFNAKGMFLGAKK